MTSIAEPRTAEIFNIQRFSTHDGPGIRTTIFFKGCPLSCWWCHNPESQSFRPDILFYDDRCRHCGDCVTACPEHNIRFVDDIPQTGAQCGRCGKCVDACVAEARRMAGRSVTVDALIAEIEKDLVFFEQSGGGITLSGGEPAAQAEFVIDLLHACRARGIHTAIETCGMAPPHAFYRMAIAADLVLFDLKLMDAEAHRRYTGVWNSRIFTNLEMLIAAGRAVTVRIPVVPGINDSEMEMSRFAGYLKALHVAGVELLPFHRIGEEKYRRLGMEYRLADTPEPAAADMSRFGALLTRAGLNVEIGGKA
jgi:pyruvate formate lyase activating enzyme